MSKLYLGITTEYSDVLIKFQTNAYSNNLTLLA